MFVINPNDSVEEVLQCLHHHFQLLEQFGGAGVVVVVDVPFGTKDRDQFALAENAATQVEEAVQKYHPGIGRCVLWLDVRTQKAAETVTSCSAIRHDNRVLTSSLSSKTPIHKTCRQKSSGRLFYIVASSHFLMRSIFAQPILLLSA